MNRLRELILDVQVASLLHQPAQLNASEQYTRAPQDHAVEILAHGYVSCRVALTSETERIAKPHLRILMVDRRSSLEQK